MENFKLTEVLETLEKKRGIYISLIQSVFKVDKDMSENIFNGELENFKERSKTYYSEQKNQKPTMSVLQGTNIFLEVIHLGLSFSKSADLIYLSRLKGTGTAVGYQPTVRGEIFLAMNSGAISHISEPVIVKNSEPFKLKTNDEGKLIAHHEIDFENQKFDYLKDFKIGYCYITYPNGDREISYTDKVKMDKSHSMSPAKAMYNDLTFLQSKVIRRALHSIRKVALHNQMEVAEDVVFSDEEREVIDNSNESRESNFDFEETETVQESEPVTSQEEEDLFNF